MKKMNNKGFAITTIVYGLSVMGIMLIAIIMGIVSSTRAHNKELTRQIAEELTRYSKTSTSFTASVSGGQEFVVPEGESGWYKIELMGAQGGGTKGGLGAYTSGIIELNEGDTLYFYVGKHKNTGEGGEETDVRIVNGGYDDFSSYSTRIMVAAGGGADEGSDGGTLVGYTKEIKSYGGQYDDNFNLIPKGENSTGTLVGFPVGIKDNYNSMISFDVGSRHLITYKADGDHYFKPLLSPRAEFNGGDGYLASHTINRGSFGMVQHGGPDYGGASMIAGYGGVFPYDLKDGNLDMFSEYPAFIYMDSSYDSSTGGYAYDSSTKRSYYFYDGMMYPGVNKGDGKARITKLMNKTEETPSLPRHNTKLDNIKYVSTCYDSSLNSWAMPQIYVVTNGKQQPTTTNSNHMFESGNKKCVISILNNVSAVDEISIWPRDLNNLYSYDDDTDYKHIRITVGREGDSCGNYPYSECPTILKDTTVYTPDISESITYTGVRFSAYQFDSSGNLPDKGNYIIQPVLYENKVLTAATTIEKEQNPVTVEYMTGERNQQWSIEKVYDTKYGDNVFKIIDLARYKALSVKNDENKLGNNIIANRTFNSTSIDETQLWKILPMKNGTYTIETVLEGYDEGVNTGYIVPQTNKNKEDYDKVIIGKKTPNPIVQRWKIISTDYSSKN